MLPLYTSFVLPFCLFPSFPSNITKHSFSLRFQLGSGMMSSCPALCGHSKNILPSASSKRELRLLNSLFTPSQGNLHFSFVQIHVCLWEVKCFHLIVIGLDWRLWKSCRGMKAKLTQGDYPLYSVQLNVEGCLPLANSGGAAHSQPFSPGGCAYLDRTCSACREGLKKSLLANNWRLKGINKASWWVSSGSQFAS